MYAYVYIVLLQYSVKFFWLCVFVWFFSFGIDCIFNIFGTKTSFKTGLLFWAKSKIFQKIRLEGNFELLKYFNT